jgi:rhodanese-related sulfurtransferase
MPDYPQEGVQRGGHVPTAQNVPWKRAANDDGSFKSVDDLRGIYEGELGMKAGDDVITYCRIGERSSHTWFVLTHLLGFEHVRNYDGSWVEWGNAVRVPIAKGAEQGGADGITAINTLIGMAVDWRKRKPILGRGIGGLSGPAIKPVALRMVHEISRAVRIPVIGVGGARTAEDVLEFVCAGASAVEVGTAAFVDPAVLVGVVDDLARLLAGANTSIAELRGSLAAPIAAQAIHAPTQGACPAPQRGAEGAASR